METLFSKVAGLASTTAKISLCGGCFLRILRIFQSNYSIEHLQTACSRFSKN